MKEAGRDVDPDKNPKSAFEKMIGSAKVRQTDMVLA
jgi:hypothetical protein